MTIQETTGISLNRNDESAQSVGESGGGLTFNDDVFRRPLLIESGEAGVLADTHHVLPEVKLLRVEAQQAEPQLPHRLGVLPQLWPTARLNTDAALRWFHARMCSFVNTGFTKCSRVLLSRQRNTRSSRRPAPQVSSAHHKSEKLRSKIYINTSDLLCIDVIVEFPHSEC